MVRNVRVSRFGGPSSSAPLPTRIDRHWFSERRPTRRQRGSQSATCSRRRRPRTPDRPPEAGYNQAHASFAAAPMMRKKNRIFGSRGDFPSQVGHKNAEDSNVAPGVSIAPIGARATGAEACAFLRLFVAIIPSLGVWLRPFRLVLGCGWRPARRARVIAARPAVRAAT